MGLRPLKGGGVSPPTATETTIVMKPLTSRSGSRPAHRAASGSGGGGGGGGDGEAEVRSMAMEHTGAKEGTGWRTGCVGGSNSAEAAHPTPIGVLVTGPTKCSSLVIGTLPV